MSKEEEATQDGKEVEGKEEEKNEEYVIVPITPAPPPTVEATPVADVTTSSPCKPKASKKRKTRSRK